MEPAAKILCVSPDPVLLQTQRWILEGYFQVDCAGTYPAASAMVERQSYNLILLCYSLKTEECGKIFHLVRAKAPQAQMLALIEGSGGCAEAYSDQQILVGEGPYALLKKVAAMIAPEIARKIRRSPRRRAVTAAKLQPGIL